MKRNSSGKHGFTLTEIMIVVALIGLLAIIAIPHSVRARNRSMENTCINNLRQIESAIEQWAIEAKQPPNATVTEANVMPYLKRSAVCPSGGTRFDDSYILTSVSDPPLCQRVPLTHIAP